MFQEWVDRWTLVLNLIKGVPITASMHPHVVSLRYFLSRTRFINQNEEWQKYARSQIAKVDLWQFDSIRILF